MRSQQQSISVHRDVWHRVMTATIKADVAAMMATMEDGSMGLGVLWPLDFLDSHHMSHSHGTKEVASAHHPIATVGGGCAAWGTCVGTWLLDRGR